MAYKMKDAVDVLRDIVGADPSGNPYYYNKLKDKARDIIHGYDNRKGE